MYHNHSNKEIVQKFLSIDTTFIDLFGSNNNNSVMFGATNIACMNSMIQFPHSSTNAAILSKNYDNNVPITSLVAGINNRKVTNTLKSKVFKVCPSDFTVHLPETLNNVIQMKVCAIDLPCPIFNVSPFHKNNYIRIEEVNENGINTATDNVLEIELPSGQYNIDQIIENLNFVIANNTAPNAMGMQVNTDISNYRFFYNSIVGRTFLCRVDPMNVENGPLRWTNALKRIKLSFSNDTESCEGPKKYRSLGTILGFRKNEYNFNEDYLNFDTQLNNIVENGISLFEGGSQANAQTTITNFSSCNWPDYSLRTTQVPKIQSGTDIFNPQGFISEGVPTDISSSYLWLIIDDFAKEQKTDYTIVSTNRSEINSSKVYCKIPLKEGKVLFDTSYFVDDYKREYFNPTNIDKLHIKLLEPSGLPAYFSHSNFNLDIQFSCVR